jgi:ammonia channel protein AmtB
MKNAVWPSSGAAFGALGWFALIYLLSTSLSQYEIGSGWKAGLIILCPAATIPGVGAWWILIANCAIYAALFEGLRRIAKKLVGSV